MSFLLNLFRRAHRDTGSHAMEAISQQDSTETQPSSLVNSHSSAGGSSFNGASQHVEGTMPISKCIKLREFKLDGIKQYEDLSSGRPPPPHIKEDIYNLRQGVQRLDAIIQGDRSHPQLVLLDSVECTFDGWQRQKEWAERSHCCHISDEDFCKRHLLPLMEKQ